jgi:lysophospholipase L1-like esterase
MLATVLLAGSATAVDSETPSGPPLPSSMLAIGDSFTAGYASGAAQCPGGFALCPAVSWSTGSGVNSHYARILAQNPAIDGRQRNAAAIGTLMAGFAGQVATGTAGGFVPEYVTVMLGAADLCFGGPTTVAAFTAAFQAGMDALVAAAPSARVLVASIWNFESMRQAVITRDPAATWPLCGNILNATNPVAPEFMTRLGDYNDALNTACASYPNCRFDGGAFFNHVWKSDEISTVDNLHPSATGQDTLAEILWRAGYWAPVPDPVQPTSDPSVPSPPPDETIADETSTVTPRFTG